MADGPHSTVRASDVVRFVNSQFSLWCDRFADTSEQDPPDPIMEELARRGNIHENRILEEEQPDIVHIAADPEEWPEGIGGMNVRIDGNNNEESFLLGINAMMGGAETLSKAMLFYLPDGMVGIPDLLRRANGKSAFGSYYYTVIEVKSARNITYAHRLQAAFYTALIGRIQRKTPRTFQIINGNGTLEEFKFADHERSLDRIMERIRDVFANQQTGGGLWPRKASVGLIYEPDGSQGGQHHADLRDWACGNAAPGGGRNNHIRRNDICRH